MPDFDALAEEFQGRARFVVVEVDRGGKALERFGAGSFPAYIVFRDGEEVDRLTFNFSSFLLEARLRRLVAGALE